MKTFFYLFITISIVATAEVFGQCTPNGDLSAFDPDMYTEDIFSTSLPVATSGKPYSTTLTWKTPDTQAQPRPSPGVCGSQGFVSDKLDIDSVTAIGAIGLTAVGNGSGGSGFSNMNLNASYCILISGTPTVMDTVINFTVYAHQKANWVINNTPFLGVCWGQGVLVADSVIDYFSYELTLIIKPGNAGISLVYPDSSVEAGSVQKVSAWVKNYGENIIDTIAVTYSIDGVVQATDVLNSSLDPSDSSLFIFEPSDRWNVPGGAAIYELCVYTSFINDPELTNDTVCKTISAGAAFSDLLATYAEVDQNLFIYEDTGSATITVTNYGNHYELNFPVTYSYTDVSVTEIVADTLWPNEELEFTFDSMYVPKTERKYEFMYLYPTIGGDVNNFNDTFTVNVQFLAPDISIDTILSPESTVELYVAQDVTIEVYNAGGNDVASFDVSYTVDGVLMQTVTIFSDSIEDDEYREYTFDSTWTPTSAGLFEICAYASHPLDIVTSNDTACKTILVKSTDLAVGELVTPSNIVYDHPTDSTYGVRTTIENVGGFFITDSITASYTINGGTAVIEKFYLDDLAPGEDINITFSEQFVYTDTEEPLICISISYANDALISNDDSCTSITTSSRIGISEHNPYALSVYPNPVENILNVEIGNMSQENLKLEVLNMLGETIIVIDRISSNKTFVDVSAITEGSYLLRLSGSNGSSVSLIQKN